MNRKTLLDIHFDDMAGLFQRLKQVRRLAGTRGIIRPDGSSNDAVLYVEGPHGERLTRLVVIEQTLTDGSTVLDMHLQEESTRENVAANHPKQATVVQESSKLLRVERDARELRKAAMQQRQDKDSDGGL